MGRVNAERPAEHVLEVVTPRTNAARLSSAEHLFGTLVPRGEHEPEPVSLEIVGDADQRRRFDILGCKVARGQHLDRHQAQQT